MRVARTGHVAFVTATEWRTAREAQRTKALKRYGRLVITAWGWPVRQVARPDWEPGPDEPALVGQMVRVDEF